jgi:hypothetical protein
MIRLALALTLTLACRGHDAPVVTREPLRIELVMRGRAAFDTLAHVTDVATATRDGETRVTIDFAPAPTPTLRRATRCDPCQPRDWSRCGRASRVT